MPLNLPRSFRASLSKSVADFGVINLFLLFVLIVVTVYPLFFVGFTTHDDAMIAINTGYDTSLIDTTWNIAGHQGRFGFIWGYPLLRLPYLVDSSAWYMSMKIGAFGFLLFALSFAVSNIFRSHWLALASLLLFLLFMQNGWSFNGLTSYPLAFNFLASVFLISIGLFATAIRRKNLTLAILSGLLYFFTLYSELFVLFFPFYVAVFLISDTQEGSVLTRLTRRKRYIFSIAVPLVVYLAIYAVWRSVFPTSYEGNNLNAFDISAAANVVLSYSLTAFPLDSLANFLWPQSAMGELSSEFKNVFLIKPVVASLIFLKLMTTTHFTVPGKPVLFGGMIVSGVGIFLPNLLLGFVEKYQSWVAAGYYSYLYTYYSLISLAVFLSLLLAYVKVKSHSWREELRLLFLLSGLVLVMGIGFAVEVRNQFINFEQKQSHRKWQLMDEVIKSSYFMEIPEGSTVVAPTLIRHYRGIVAVTAYYWTKYTNYKSGKNIQFVDSKCVSGTPCYLAIFRQEAESDNQYIVLAKITNPDTLTSSDLIIYTMLTSFDSTLTGSFEPGDSSPQIEIDGRSIAKVGNGSFSLKLASITKRNLVQGIRISSNVEISPYQIKVSN